MTNKITIVKTGAAGGAKAKKDWAKTVSAKNWADNERFDRAMVTRERVVAAKMWAADYEVIVGGKTLAVEALTYAELLVLLHDTMVKVSAADDHALELEDITSRIGNVSAWRPQTKEDTKTGGSK